MKIDRRIKYKIVLDTETCPIDKDLDGVLPSNMFTYDIGWVVTDKRGIVYETRSFIVSEIFLSEKDLMSSAYYADKIPNYWEDIKNGSRIIKPFYFIRKQLLEDMRTYGITQVFAHNMRFDYGTLNSTERWLTKSKLRYFFPYGTEICDTLKMARQVLGNMPTYQRFCEENGYMTKHKTPRPQYKAETIYRFITKDTTFVESHTALEDVMIEKEILKYCYRQHKKMEIHLWED